MLAIRSTANCMELPIASDGHLLVDDSYLKLLVREANSRLMANFFRIDKFLLALKAHWQWPLLRYVRTSGLVRRWGHSVCSNARSEGCLVVGGYGAELGTAVSLGGSYGGTSSSSMCRRGLHTLSICSDDDRSGPQVLNMTEDCMHAAVAVVELGSIEAVTGNRSLLIVSGGRRSPSEALPCLRLYDTRRDYSLVEALILGGEPSHRWGHSFSLIHAGRCHCTFFLHGGRDHRTVFDDSFLVQIQWTSTGSCSILCVWRKIGLHVPAYVRTQELDNSLLSPRFFHAASTTPNVFPSRDDSCADGSAMPYLRCDGSWRTNDGGIEDDWVIIHGGITSLDAAASSTTSCCLYMVNTNTGEVSDLRERVLDDDMDPNSSVMSVCRFGHTLTSIGAKSFLLLGGSSICGDDSSDRDTGSPTIVIHLYNDRIGLYKAKLRRICGTGINNDSLHSIVAGVVVEQEPRWCQLPCQACRVHHQAVLQGSSNHQNSSEGNNRQRLLILGGGVLTLAFGPHFCCDLQLWLLTSEDSPAFDRPTASSIGSDLGSTSNRPALTHAYKQSNKQPVPMGSMGCVLFLPTFLVRKMKVCLEAMGCLDKSRSIVKVGGGYLASSAVIVITLDRIDCDSSSSASQSILPAVSDVIAGYDTLRQKRKEEDDAEVSSLMALPISQTLYESFCSDNAHTSPSRRSNKYISDIQRSIIGIEYLLLGQGYVHDSAAAAKPMSGVQRASQFLQALSDRHNLPLSISEDPNTAAVAGSSSSCQHPKQGMKFEIVGNVLMIPETFLLGLDWEKVFALPHREVLVDEEGEGEESAGGSSLLSPEADDGNGPTDEAVTYGSYVFRSLAACFGLKRVARKATIDSGPKRESRVRLLYPHQGQPDATGPEAAGWVTVAENRIRFGFDITRVMFCSGNVTERMRMGQQRAEGEVVVDLYCGIGYYSLPLLVHAHAAHVHACEWNDHSLQALRENLSNASMLERCTIHAGDNQLTSRSLVDIADRVLLGKAAGMHAYIDDRCTDVLIGAYSGRSGNSIMLWNKSSMG